MRKFPILFLAFVLGMASANASDFQSPRTMALGGAGHAGPLLNDPIYLNPAYISFNQTYGIEYSYMKFSAGDAYHGRNYNASIMDGRTELFQAGVGYTAREDGGLVTLAASKQVNELFSVGAGGKMLIARSGSNPKDSFVGVGAIPNSWLQLSLLGDNLVSSQAGQARGFQREAVLGSKFNVLGVVLAYVDPHVAPQAGTRALGYEVGLEFPLMKDLFLRGGTFRNANIPFQTATRGNGFAFGGGWVGPRLSIDYAFQRVDDSRSGIQQTVTNNLGATVFF